MHACSNGTDAPTTPTESLADAVVMESQSLRRSKRIALNVLETPRMSVHNQLNFHDNIL